MTTSLTQFRDELTEALLDFIWRQWCLLGVAGTAHPLPEHRIIDPEALFAFSSTIARHDARLFDEIMDWTLKNGKWINIQRLSNIIVKDHIGETATVGAIADWMASHDVRMKWKGVAAKFRRRSDPSPEMLFHSQRKSKMPPLKDQDPVFSEYGLIRPPISLRGLSHSVDLTADANMVIRLRGLFGVGVRADVISYLLTHESGHARHIAEFLGYNHMRVQELLNNLVEAGLLGAKRLGRKKEHFVRRREWRAALSLSDSPLEWIDWRAFYRGIGKVFAALWSIDEQRADEYIAVSLLNDAMDQAETDLYRAGLDLSSDSYAASRDWTRLNNLAVSVRELSQG